MSQFRMLQFKCRNCGTIKFVYDSSVAPIDSTVLDAFGVKAEAALNKNTGHTCPGSNKAGNYGFVGYTIEGH